MVELREEELNRETCVAFVLCLFTGGGKQVDVASNVAAVFEVWLERFYRNLTYVDVYRQ